LFLSCYTVNNSEDGKEANKLYQRINDCSSILLAITWTAHSDKIPDFDLIVAQDGLGDFTTITDAIFAAPNFGLTRYRIKIRAETYKENIVIGREKQNLTLISDGMDSTIITWRKGFDDVNSTSLTATVGELVIQK
jgi:pectin methylesterase-like acyl-CoA thioesterase